MDHKHQLDPSHYKITYSTSENGVLGFRHQEYEREPLPSFATLAKRHVIFEKSPVLKEPHAIIFETHCEYTGIHYHSLRIYEWKEGEKTLISKHGAGTDGSLCYPSYEAFLIAKLKYWEDQKVSIYIEKKLLTKESFYDKSW